MNPNGTESALVVMIVEDHAAVRKSLRECVHASFPDIRLLEARCGEEALVLAAKESPHIVLMDFRLPGIDGVEATRWIRMRIPGCRIVMVSIHEDEAHRAAAAAAGADAFIAKRNLPGELVRLLEALVPGGARTAVQRRRVGA